MWMYSSFIKQKIKIRDEKKIIKLKEKHKIRNDIIIISKDKVEINFMFWDGWKIWWYFYNECQDFLKDLAKCIDWFVEFEYEDWDTPFKIIFSDNKVYEKRAEIVVVKRKEKKELVYND